MFDVIGKRRWFYLISLAITIPGLFFILLTPFTSDGLQFTIDYTGGTTWEIRFEDPNVTPDQVEAVFKSQGLEATAVTTGDRLHRDQDRADRRGRCRRSLALAVGVRGPQRLPGRQREPRRVREPIREPIPEPQPITERVAVGVGVGCAVGLAGRFGGSLVVTGTAGRKHQDPDRGQAR